MHQPMQGAQAQVRRRNKTAYNFGWNDYIDGVCFGLMQNEDEQDGWLDCQEATENRGVQEKIYSL